MTPFIWKDLYLVKLAFWFHQLSRLSHSGVLVPFSGPSGLCGSEEVWVHLGSASYSPPAGPGAAGFPQAQPAAPSLLPPGWETSGLLDQAEGSSSSRRNTRPLHRSYFHSWCLLHRPPGRARREAPAAATLLEAGLGQHPPSTEANGLTASSEGVSFPDPELWRGEDTKHATV